MKHPLLWLEWTGYAAGLGAAWWLLGKLDWACREWRRKRANERRLARFRPVATPRDPGDDLTRLMPAIQRPRKERR